MADLARDIWQDLGAGGLRADFIEWLPKLVAAFLILGFFWLLWRAARRAADALIARTRLDPTAASFLHAVVKTVLLSVGAVTALGKLGVNTASILTSLGVAGLTIGFAAKDALSNMISGLFIFWDRPFVIGDLVEIGGHYGRVDTITLRSTRVVTPDGRMLAVPNTTIVNTTVASYTNFPHLRLDIAFTVGVGEDLGKVRQTALSVCQGDPRFIREPASAVVVTALNDYNVALELRAWLGDEKQHIEARHELRERLFEALRAANIDMPLETLAIAPLTLNQGPEGKRWSVPHQPAS